MRRVPLTMQMAQTMPVCPSRQFAPAEGTIESADAAVMPLFTLTGLSGAGSPARRLRRRPTVPAPSSVTFVPRTCTPKGARYESPAPKPLSSRSSLAVSISQLCEAVAHL